MVKVGKYKRPEYHKAGSSQPFSALGDVEKSFYKARIWVGLEEVNKAWEERQDTADEEAACAKMWSLAITSHVQRSTSSLVLVKNKRPVEEF